MINFLICVLNLFSPVETFLSAVQYTFDIFIIVLSVGFHCMLFFFQVNLHFTKEGKGKKRIYGLVEARRPSEQIPSPWIQFGGILLRLPGSWNTLITQHHVLRIISLPHCNSLLQKNNIYKKKKYDSWIVHHECVQWIALH